MSIRDYQPTHRESDVVHFMKVEPDRPTTPGRLAKRMGIHPDIATTALENLEMIGCVQNVGGDKYVFVKDPLDAV